MATTKTLKIREAYFRAKFLLRVSLLPGYLSLSFIHTQAQAPPFPSPSMWFSISVSSISFWFFSSSSYLKPVDTPRESSSVLEQLDISLGIQLSSELVEVFFLYPSSPWRFWSTVTDWLRKKKKKIFGFCSLWQFSAIQVTFGLKCFQDHKHPPSTFDFVTIFKSHFHLFWLAND